MAEGGEGVAPSASALGMKRLRETPPQQRLRNARRAVKRLRHEARYDMPCDDMHCFLVGRVPADPGPVLVAREGQRGLGGAALLHGE